MKNFQKGFTLIENMLAIGLVALIALALFHLTVGIDKNLSINEKFAKKIALMNYINNTFDCRNTVKQITPMVCNDNTAIKVRDKFDQELPEQFGDFSIKAYCNGNGFKFQAIHQANPNKTMNLFDGARYCSTQMVTEITRSIKVPLTKTAEDCAIMFRASVIPPPYSVYSATIDCGTGYRVVTGGVYCGDNGILVTSRFSDNSRQRWLVECCASDNEVPNLLKTGYVMCQLGDL